MGLMKALLSTEEIPTSEGRKKVTYEAYNFVIKPYCSPPIVLEIVKGNISNGKFKPIVESAKKFLFTFEEYKLLMLPNANGKPAGDFRLSDVVDLIRKRNARPIPADSPSLE